jgi:hypothetical protein
MMQLAKLRWSQQDPLPRYREDSSCRWAAEAVAVAAAAAAVAAVVAVAAVAAVAG